MVEKIPWKEASNRHHETGKGQIQKPCLANPRSAFATSSRKKRRNSLRKMFWIVLNLRESKTSWLLNKHRIDVNAKFNIVFV